MLKEKKSEPPTPPSTCLFFFCQQNNNSLQKPNVLKKIFLAQRISHWVWDDGRKKRSCCFFWALSEHFGKPFQEIVS